MEAAERDRDKVLRAGFAAFVFLLVVAMFPLTPDPAGDVKILLYHWAAFGFTAAWLVGMWEKDQRTQRPRIFFGILLAFLLLSLVSCLRSSYIGNSLVEVSKFGSLFLIYFVASQAYRTPAQVRRLMLVSCIAVACSSIYAFCQKAGIDPFPWGRDQSTFDAYSELPGTFGNGNFAAHAMILCQVMALYLATQKGWRWCLGFSALFAVHHYFTGQRAGVLALAAAGTLVVVARLVAYRVKRPVVAAAMSILLTAVVGLVSTAAIMVAMKARTGSPFPLDLALLTRYKSYSSAAGMVIERPLLGYGPGNYKIENTPFWTPHEQRWFAERRLMNANAHHDILECAADTGVVGAALYVAFLVMGMGFGLLMAFTRDSASERRLGFTFAALFCAFMVDGFFGFNLRVPVSAVLLFLAAGAMEGIWISAETRPPRSAPPLGRSLLWRGAVLVIVLTNVVFGTRVFASEFLLQRGAGAMYWKAYTDAEHVLRRGEQLTPWNWLFGFKRGMISFRQDAFDLATTHFERALTRNPYYIPTLIALSRSYFNKGAPVEFPQPRAGGPVETSHLPLDAAAKYAERALELCPMLPEAEDTLGRIAVLRATEAQAALAAGESTDEITQALQNAEDHLRNALEHGAPNQAELLRLLTTVHLAQRDFARAEDALVRAVQADPADGETWPLFFQYAGEQGRFDRLRSVLRSQIARLSDQEEPERPALATAHLWLARVHEEGYHDVDEAESAYLKAVELAPVLPDVWSNFAQFATAHTRLDRFRSTLLETRAQLLKEGTQPPPSVEAVAMVWERGPAQLAEATAILVDALQTGRVAKGISTSTPELEWAAAVLASELSKASPTTGKLGVAFHNLGVLHSSLGDLEQANASFTAALPHLSSEVDKAICVFNQADVLTRLERYEEVEKLLRGAMPVVRKSMPLSEVYAQTLARNGRTAEARLEYMTILNSFSLDTARRQAIQERIDALRK